MSQNLSSAAVVALSVNSIGPLYIKGVAGFNFQIKTYFIPCMVLNYTQKKKV